MFLKRFQELNSVVEKCVYTTPSNVISEDESLDMTLFLFNQIKKTEGIIYLIGNGGSSAIASHFCTDFLRTLKMPAATLSDASTLSCFANDFGYENVYKLPLQQNLRNKDLLIAISSSGQSVNILEPARYAKEKKIPLITLSGFSKNNPLRKLGDLNFWIDSSDYGLVETAHFFLLHTIVDICKQRSEALKLSAH